MNAKKMVRKELKALEHLATNRRSCGNVGGLKMLPTLTHGAETAPRVKNVPVSHGTKVNLDAYEDYE